MNIILHSCEFTLILNQHNVEITLNNNEGTLMNQSCCATKCNGKLFPSTNVKLPIRFGDNTNIDIDLIKQMERNEPPNAIPCFSKR